MIILRPLEPWETTLRGKKYCRIEKGVSYATEDSKLYEIIDTPQPERDWSDVVERIYKLAKNCDFFTTFQIPAIKILQQAAIPDHERDWSDVVEKLVKCAEETYETKSFFNENIFRSTARQILQQADKPAPEKQKVKRWVNIYRHASGTFHCNKENADFVAGKNNDRIACKEIEIEYEIGEGLND